MNLSVHGGYQCRKQRVLAVAIVDGKVLVAENEVRVDHGKCPREVQGYTTGKGYHLCRAECWQFGHAEQRLIALAQGNLHKATVHIFGHHYVCDECKIALIDANAGEAICHG